MPDPITTSPVVSNVKDLMTPSTKPVASPNPNGELGKDAFLKLLVAQLKYQDPSSPVDSSQFMAQTAAFTQVEKLDAMAKDSSANLALQQGLAASALVGRSVSYVDENGITQRGVVSSASFGGSGSAEPAVHIGDKAVALSSIVSVDDGAAPVPPPTGGAAAETADAPGTTADDQDAQKAAEQKAAEQKALTDAISAALAQAFAGGVTGSIADAVARAVAAAMPATTPTTGTDATTTQGTGTDATATTPNPAPAGPTS